METKTIAVDFGGTEIYTKIEEGLEGLEIGLLGEFMTCMLAQCCQVIILLLTPNTLSLCSSP